MGGRVKIDSPKGSGTCVSVLFAEPRASVRQTARKRTGKAIGCEICNGTSRCHQKFSTSKGPPSSELLKKRSSEDRRLPWTTLQPRETQQRQASRARPTRIRDAIQPEAKRLVIVDDHPLFRKGLEQLIHSDSAFAVCGEASNASEAMEVIRRLHPDLAIVDLSLPGANGNRADQEYPRRVCEAADPGALDARRILYAFAGDACRSRWVRDET